MIHRLSTSEGIKPRLLITGASGLLGHALCFRALPQWSVLALYRRNKPQVKGVTAFQIDLTDTFELKRLVTSLAPAAVIHAAAASQVGTCETHPRRTAAINIEASAHLADLCADGGMDYLFTSTDLVFDGLQAPYDEEAPVRPVCTYGEQKALAEEAVLRRYPSALVCRLPLMVGMAPFGERHFTLQMLEAFRQGRAVSLLTDEFRTPVDTDSAAQGILHLLGRAKGLLHLGGRTRISRYDLGCLVAAQMQAPLNVLRPVTIDALGLSVNRAPDCTLISEKAYLRGYNPASLTTTIKTLVDRFNVITNA